MTWKTCSQVQNPNLMLIITTSHHADILLQKSQLKYLPDEKNSEWYLQQKLCESDMKWSNMNCCSTCLDEGISDQLILLRLRKELCRTRNNINKSHLLDSRHQDGLITILLNRSKTLIFIESSVKTNCITSFAQCV